MSKTDYFSNEEFWNFVGAQNMLNYSAPDIDTAQEQVIETLEAWASSAWPNAGVVIGTGNMTAASAILTLTSGAFLDTDIEKQVLVAGAGVAGATLKTTISTWTSATQVTLATTATTTVTNTSITWGDGDGTAASARTTTEFFDGDAKTIMLGQVPIIGLTTIALDGSVMDAEIYDLYSPGGYLRFDNPLSLGPRVLEVTYTYGFTSTPWAIKRPAMQAAKTMLDYQTGNSKIPMSGLTYYQTERATFSWARRRLSDRPPEPWPWDIGASEAIRSYWEPQKPIGISIV